MESDGERARIQVREAMSWRFCQRYRLEKRGEINVKGYPQTTVYDLIGPLGSDPSHGVRPGDETGRPSYECFESTSTISKSSISAPSNFAS